MCSPEQHPITDEEAKTIAKELVRVLFTPVRILGLRSYDEPITIADMIRVGGMVVNGVNQATRNILLKETNRQNIAKVLEGIVSPEGMEEHLSALIVARQEDPNEIQKAIAELQNLMSGPGADRNFLKKAIAEAMPKLRQGRPTDFDPASDPKQFLALSAQLSCVCDLFLGLREKFPNKSSRTLMDFLESDDPIAETIMRKHEDHISQAMSEPDFQTLKRHNSKVRRLADALAGKELFGWSFVYAFQRGAEFRRLKGAESEE